MTDAELTILSLLAQGARYGHDIQQLIDERGLREWVAIGFSSVYYILNKFEKQGMVTSELRAEGRGAARKLYSLTEAGRGVLQTAVSDLLRRPRSLGAGFELGLANLYVLKPAQVYQVLSYHRKDLQEQYLAVKQSWERHRHEGDDSTRDHIRALYTHSLAMMEADIAWLGNFLEDWRARYPSVEREAANAARSDAHAESSAATQIHRSPTPDPLKMIQRLQRPPLPPREEPSDDE